MLGGQSKTKFRDRKMGTKAIPTKSRSHFDNNSQRIDRLSLGDDIYVSDNSTHLRVRASANNNIRDANNSVVYCTRRVRALALSIHYHGIRNKSSNLKYLL